MAKRLISETEALILYHLQRFHTCTDPTEIAQLRSIGRFMSAVCWKLDAAGMLAHGGGGFAITPAGRAALAHWREEHGGDAPRTASYRREMRGDL